MPSRPSSSEITTLKTIERSKMRHVAKAESLKAVARHLQTKLRYLDDKKKTTLYALSKHFLHTPRYTEEGRMTRKGRESLTGRSLCGSDVRGSGKMNDSFRRIINTRSDSIPRWSMMNRTGSRFSGSLGTAEQMFSISQKPKPLR